MGINCDNVEVSDISEDDTNVDVDEEFDIEFDYIHVEESVYNYSSTK